MRFILTLTLLVFSFGLAAQTDETDISTTLNEYFELIGKKNISKALDYVHPGLIEMMGKEMFEQQYNQLFNSPGMQVSIDSFYVESISARFVHKDKKFAQVHYGFRMTFKVDMSNDKDGVLGPFLLGTYQSQFGKENVTSPENGTYLITTGREMFACNEPSFEGWKILDYEPGMKIFLKSILPEELFTHFKK